MSCLNDTFCSTRHYYWNISVVINIRLVEVREYSQRRFVVYNHSRLIINFNCDIKAWIKLVSNWKCQRIQQHQNGDRSFTDSSQDTSKSTIKSHSSTSCVIELDKDSEASYITSAQEDMHYIDFARSYKWGVTSKSPTIVNEKTTEHEKPVVVDQIMCANLCGKSFK